jgi:malate dehydrogenase (oxaloacetate-decarboxylating)
MTVSDSDAKPTSRRMRLSTKGPLECSLKGTALLNHPYFNKGSAFTKEERRDFELSGLLPPSIQTLEQQVQRAYEQYSTRPDDLAKNTFLTSMKEQNEVLYFKVGPPAQPRMARKHI